MENLMNHANPSSTAAENESGSQDHHYERNGRVGAHENYVHRQSESEGRRANGAEGNIFLKILVPSVAAGAIIGKGGETIAMLQQQTQTRIKMSKATDFFPGTNERVCIIYGATQDGILQVYDFVAQKIREKPDPGAKPAVDFDTKQPAEREKQVKILVPNSTAGMIIGKGGNYIKIVKEESGSYVQISQKAKDHAISERCITIIGEAVSNRKAVSLILAKIFEDPQSNSCPNLSYADVIGPVPNYNPTGSPFATPMHHPLNHHHLDHPMLPYATNPHHFINSLRQTLRMTGYSEEATSEIIAAMTTLASYGILGLGLGLGMGLMPPFGGPPDHGYASGSTGLSSSPMGGSPAGYPESIHSHGSASLSPMRPNGQLDGQFDGPYDGQHHFHPHSGRGGRDGYWKRDQRGWNNGDQTVPSLNGEKMNHSVEIAESMVEAILGRDGKVVREIQEMSGAQIFVASKKKFSNGKRIVNISGSPTAVRMAESMIADRTEERIGTDASASPTTLSPSSQYN